MVTLKADGRSQQVEDRIGLDQSIGTVLLIEELRLRIDAELVVAKSSAGDTGSAAG